MQKSYPGPNPILIEDDLIFSTSNVPSTLEIVNDYLTTIEPVFAIYGHAFLLTDATKTLAITAEARRAIAEWGKTHRIAASAVFGPSGSARAMLTLVSSAMKLISNNDQNIRFFATESAARAWIDEQRKQFYNRRPKV